MAEVVDRVVDGMVVVTVFVASSVVAVVVGDWEVVISVILSGVSIVVVKRVVVVVLVGLVADLVSIASVDTFVVGVPTGCILLEVVLGVVISLSATCVTPRIVSVAAVLVVDDSVTVDSVAGELVTVD